MVSNQKVSVKQIMILLVLNLVGAASLVIPRVATEYAEQDGWILIIGAGILSSLYALCITFLVRRFPGMTFREYCQVIVGKPFAIVLCVAFLIQISILAGFELRIFGELTNQMLLNRTPIEIVLLIILLVAVYLGRKGYEVRARMGELLIYLALIPIAIVFIFGIFSVELSNLAPFFVADYKQIIKGSYAVSVRFLALEFLLLGASYVTEPKKLSRAAVKSIIAVTCIHLVIFVITIGVFGVGETNNHIWPVIPMMKVITLPKFFVDRQDALLMTFWIFTAFMYFNSLIFFASFLIQDIFRLKNRDYIVLPLVPVFYVLALIPDNIVQTYNYLHAFLEKGGLAFTAIVPIALLIIAHIRGKRGPENEQQVNKK